MKDMTKAEGKKAEKHSGKTSQLIVFQLGGVSYALHIDQIKEVVITPQITRLPQTPEYIKGVANIRGNIITILDLEERFELKEAEDMQEDEENVQYTLVMESEEYKAGILVNKVPDTLNVAEEEIEDAGNIASNGALDGQYIQGIVKQENQLIVLMDMLKLVESLDSVHMLKAKKNVNAA